MQQQQQSAQYPMYAYPSYPASYPASFPNYNNYYEEQIRQLKEQLEREKMEKIIDHDSSGNGGGGAGGSTIIQQSPQPIIVFPHGQEHNPNYGYGYGGYGGYGGFPATYNFSMPPMPQGKGYYDYMSEWMEKNYELQNKLYGPLYNAVTGVVNNLSEPSTTTPFGKKRVKSRRKNKKLIKSLIK